MKTPTEKVYPEITLDIVNALFSFDRKTGALTWKQTRSRLAKAGQLAGTIDKAGYVGVTIMGRRIAAPRLVYFMAHRGRWPDGKLYCVDGDKENLRLDNWVLEADYIDPSPQAVKRRQYWRKWRDKVDAQPYRAAHLERKQQKRDQTLEQRAQRAEARKPLLSGKALLVRHPRLGRRAVKGVWQTPPAKE